MNLEVLNATISSSLVKQFPEFKEKIHELKMENNHFADLMKRYEDVDKHVFRIESDEEPTGDEYLRELKKKRLQLMDEITRSLTIFLLLENLPLHKVRKFC